MGSKRDELLGIIQIDNVFDLINYVSELNAGIRERNKILPPDKREKELNLSYILKRYEKMKRKEEIAEFREKHECKYCLYFDKPRRCMAADNCPIENEFDWKIKEEKRYIQCPRYEIEGPCPYGNEVGTCFGYCARDIVKEMKTKKVVTNEG